MKKELTLNEMYRLVLHHLPIDTRTGICVVIYNMLVRVEITRNEYEHLYQHFQSQKPRKIFFNLITINKQFLEHPLYTGRTWWWEYDSDISAQQEQRRLFIEHLINKTK